MPERIIDPEAPARLLAKVREFVDRELDPDERVLFARLLAPGVATAFVEDEVEGFSMVEVPEDGIAAALAAALARSGMRVVFDAE